MNRWLELLTRHSNDDLNQWFARLADHLLNRTRLLVAGETHRLTEIEFYFHSHEHPDPFTHFNPIQAETGRWYFHRTGNAYRGGSFKGIDITFGDGQSRAGILIRGLVTPSGQFLSGPSLLVDYLLAKSKLGTVAELDAIVGRRRIWDRLSSLKVVELPAATNEVFACSRVGLSLKRAVSAESWANYLLRPYRFLTEPRKIKKGKAQLAISLHRLGQSIDDILRTTGCPARVVRRYVAEYDVGRAGGGFEEYLGRALSPTDICRLHGIADRLSAPPITRNSSSPQLRDNS